MRKIIILTLCFLLVCPQLSLALASARGEGMSYICPMHSHIISGKPGNCPICGMDLVLIEEDSGFNETSDEIRIKVSPRMIQSLGVKTHQASFNDFTKVIKTYGEVVGKQDLMYDVSIRVSGWIKDLNIKAIGEKVEVGQLLYTIYSPDLLTMQRDFISNLAYNNSGRIESSRRLLMLSGVDNDTINLIEKNKKAITYLPFYAEKEGIVTELYMNSGSYITTGMKIMHIENYAQVAINVSLLPEDLPFLDPKSQFKVITLSGKEIMAEFDFIYPQATSQTRQLLFRLVLDNPDYDVRVGDGVMVQFQSKESTLLSIPKSALLQTSQGNYVIKYSNEAQGFFTKSLVEIGLYNNELVEVTKGIEEGDNVVISGQFLFNSESNLRESINKFRME